jgi:hypothetical protein
MDVRDVIWHCEAEEFSYFVDVWKVFGRDAMESVDYFIVVHKVSESEKSLSVENAILEGEVTQFR